MRYCCTEHLVMARRDRQRAAQRGFAASRPAYIMLHDARKRSKLSGRQVTITEADIVIPAVCPILEIELTRGQGRACSSSPVLDRIRNADGYIPGNVHVVSLLASTIKADLPLVALADGAAGPEWQRWAIAYLAAQNWRPRRRVVRRRTDHV
jgi:hypothetical protein